MKIALITDTHWGTRSDNGAFYDYFETFYRKTFFPTIDDRNIDTIIHLGDIVDRRKYISYVTLRKMKDIFVSECQKRDIDLHVIVGNHDVSFKNTNDVNSMNELFGADHYVKYYSEPAEVEFDGNKLMLMPWINNENYADAIKAMDETTAQVLFGHLEIAGCFMDRGNVNEHGMKLSDFAKFDLVCSGHFHHKSTTENINYLGAPYELTWIDYQDPKGFHIYDTETRELEFIKNPYSMFHKVFYSDENKTMEELLDFDESVYNNTYVKVIKQTCDNPYWFDMFMDKIYKANAANIQIVDDHLNLNLEDDGDIINEAEDTGTIMHKYIEALPDTVPKKELDGLMKTLYNEALSLGY